MRIPSEAHAAEAEDRSVTPDATAHEIAAGVTPGHPHQPDQRRHDGKLLGVVQATT